MVGQVFVDLQLGFINDHLAHILQGIQLGQFGIAEHLMLLAVFIQHDVFGLVSFQIPLGKQVLFGQFLVFLREGRGKKQHACRESRKQSFHTRTQSVSSSFTLCSNNPSHYTTSPAPMQPLHQRESAEFTILP